MQMPPAAVDGVVDLTDYVAPPTRHRPAPAPPPQAARPAPVPPQAVPGRHALDLMRKWCACSNHRLTLLLGAFRSQTTKPLHRFSSGQGSFSGPYFGIDQPSDKLTLDLFRNALMQLHIQLPLSESEGLFAVMADEDGLVGIQDLLKEMKADPCDASGRWNCSSKVIGQHGPPRGVTHIDHIAPTRRSGYSGHHYRAPPKPPKPAHRPAPSAPEKENYRVAPSESGFTHSTSISLGTDAPEDRKPSWRAPPARPPPKPDAPVMYPRKTPSAYAAEPGVHTEAEPQYDGPDGRWERSSLGHRRAPPARPAFVGRVAPSESGFTHHASIFLAGKGSDGPSTRHQPRVVPTVAPKAPWVSGYNRGERNNFAAAKEAWAAESAFERPAPPPPPPPPDSVIVPTRRSGFTYESSFEEPAPDGKCAFCRLHG